MKKEYWIVAIDSDSFNYEPQKIPHNLVQRAKKMGYTIYPSKEECQKACDRENSL